MKKQRDSYKPSKEKQLIYLFTVPGEVFPEEMGLFHYLLRWRYFIWKKRFKLTTGKEKTLLYYIEELNEIEGDI